MPDRYSETTTDVQLLQTVRTMRTPNPSERRPRL
jgi:hypothetical protein